MKSSSQLLALVGLLSLAACEGGSTQSGAEPVRAPVCEGTLSGYGDTFDGRRPMIPLSLERGTGTVVDGSGCSAVEGGVSCQGLATVTATEGSFVLTFADDSKLTWTETAATVGPPMAENGARVRVEYQELVFPLCTACGSYGERTLRVYSEDETLLWIGQEGQELEPIDDATVTALFGTSASDVLECEQTVGDCYQGTRQTFSHLLDTEPPQTVPAAVVTRVSTPSGNFDVSWVESAQLDTHPIDKCNDGGSIAADNGFSARRVLE